MRRSPSLPGKCLLSLALWLSGCSSMLPHVTSETSGFSDFETARHAIVPCEHGKFARGWRTIMEPIDADNAAAVFDPQTLLIEPFSPIAPSL